MDSMAEVLNFWNRDEKAIRSFDSQRASASEERRRLDIIPPVVRVIQSNLSQQKLQLLDGRGTGVLSIHFQ